MQRGQAEAVDQLPGALQQGRPDRSGVRAGAVQEARTGHRGERNGPEQLGIVAAAGALVRIGPAVVEDVLALAVALEPEGHDAEDAAIPV